MKTSNFAGRFFLLFLIALMIRPTVTLAGGHQFLSGHVPFAVRAGLVAIDRLPPTNRLHLAIALPLRNQLELTNLLREIYNPASPNYHHYLTTSQFTEEFGPTEGDYLAAADFARSNGLVVTGTHPNRRLLDVSGAVADIERTFHVTMRVYRHPTESRTFYSPDTEPSVDLAVPVQHIAGLDNYSLPKSYFHATPLAKTSASPTNAALATAARQIQTQSSVSYAFGTNGSGLYGSYWGFDFRGAYVPGTTLNGAGQSIGLLEFDGYNSNDIAYYEKSAGGTNRMLPACTLSNILIDGFSGNPTGNGGEKEVSLDIEMAISMATNLTGIYVYECNPTNGTWDDLLNRMATDNLSRQLSSSWGQNGTYDDVVGDGILEEMAAQGQSFFQASGDNGGYPALYTTLIAFPCANPWVTSVGGTVLTTAGPGSNWVSETVWNTLTDGNFEGVGASGGGIGDYPIPDWQADVSMAGNMGSPANRNYPDVAMVADNVYVRANTNDYRIDGTSCAAPLWAGLMALVNQAAAAQGQPVYGFANPAIYALAEGPGNASLFHDITNGESYGNYYYNANSFTATNGYDLCTGWGTPGGTNLINALLASDANFSLVTPVRVEAPAAGSDGSILSVSPNSGSWLADTNSASLPFWLHLSISEGTGGTNIVFSCDANSAGVLPSGTRTGTFIVAGLTNTIIQAGSAYVQSSFVTNLMSGGLASSNGLAVDAAGNLYVADTGNNAIKKWTLTNNTVTTVVPSSMGLSHPQGVAVDAAGDLFIADSGNNAIKELAAGGGALTTKVAIGLNAPGSVAVDSAGDLYIADTGNNALKELPAGSSSVITNISTGLNAPAGVAVDGVGNVYIADTGNNAVKELLAGANSPVALVSTGLSGPAGVAADGARNIYIADAGDNAVKVWTAASNTVTAVLSAGLNHPTGVAVDLAGNVYVDDTGNNAVKEHPYVFLIPSARQESPLAGTDALSVVLPVAANLGGPFTPVTDQPWLTVISTNAGVVSFAFTTNTTVSSRTAHILMLGQSIAITQASPYALGTTARLEGPLAGSDTIVLGVNPNTAAWTNSANNGWLHLSAANQTGMGSTNIVFSFDANPGGTRAGTLTIEGLTVTITQAGSTYVAASQRTNLVSTGLEDPTGITVDGAGNVYFSDSLHNAVDKWTPANNTISVLVTNSSNAGILPAYEPASPEGLALDGSGNVYIADENNEEIEELAANDSAGTNLVHTGILGPYGLTIDSVGNLYFTVFSQILKWSPQNLTLTTNFAVAAGNYLNGITMDNAGNTYIAFGQDNAITKLGVGATTLTTVYNSGLNYPIAVAVDGAGNVYFADSGNNAIKKWTALTGLASTLVSGLGNPEGVAVDGAGNVYFANTFSNLVGELQYGFVDATPRQEHLGSGTDSLPAVLPATANLTGRFAPTSDQAWLTVTGVTNAVVYYAFAANTTVGSRTGHITVLGQPVAITQVSPYTLGTLSRLEGPVQGTDSVVLAVSPSFPSWTNSANTTWLHLSAPNQIGTGNTNIVFSFDANTGATRTGTLTLCGQTFTVTQAGSTYVAAGAVTNLLTAATASSNSVAVDSFGNVYLANSSSATIQEWSPANNSASNLVTSGLIRPTGVAADGAGNLYIADNGSDSVKKWTASTGSLSSLVSSGLSNAYGLSVDGGGNVFIADAAGRVEEWNASSSTLTTNVSSGLNDSSGVAVDVADNLYLADTGDNAVKELFAGGSSLTSLVSSGLSNPFGVAADSAGNVYVADTGNNVVKKWSAIGGAVTTNATGLIHPTGVAVDAAGNLYIADNSTNVLKELPRAFVDPTSKAESPAGGSDTLPVVLPATADLGGPFTPTSDQPWLTITGTNGGIVSFAFTGNNGLARTAHISVLGQAVTITQASPYSLGTTSRLVGPVAGTDSVLLAESPVVGSWTAATNASWLHLSPANQTGTGSARVVFTYDANLGITRTGTLTVAGLTFTVTQAASNYIAAGVVTNVVAGLNLPFGVAADTAGNVYVADTYNNAIRKWSPASNTVTLLLSAGLSFPRGVAVDTNGNVYIADSGNNQVKKLPVGGGAVTTNVTGLSTPGGVAVDGAGNLFIADTYNNAIKKWTAVSNSVSVLVSGYQPVGVAVDVLGNVFFVQDSGVQPGAFEWLAATSNSTTLTTSGAFSGVGVDGLGNAYLAGDGSSLVEWAVVNSNLTTLVSSPTSSPFAAAVDGAGNVYIANAIGNRIDELPYAFVAATPRSESLTGGSDALPAILPATANLSGPLAPASDSSWLTITGTNGGVVSFNFAPNTGPGRTGHISLLGQSIAIVQGGSTYAIGASNLLVGPVAGSNSIVLGVSPNSGTWSNSTSTTWLHLSPANQSGVGTTNIVFTYDANPGGSRAGSLVVEGVTVAITQAGSTYVAANWVTNLVSSGLSSPSGVAVDASGSVYFADTGNNAIKKWTVANTLSTLVSTGFSSPWGVAVDGGGNVYIADRNNNAIKEWSVAGGNVTALVSGLNNPTGVAVDGAGDVYFSNTGGNWVGVRSAIGGTVTTNAFGLSSPTGVAVDVAGNEYFADTGNNAVKEWLLANSNVISLASSLNHPTGVAVDGGGNVYFADSTNNAIKKRSAAGGVVSSLVSGLSSPAGVAVDTAGNVYFADSGNNAIKELPDVFVDPTARTESASAGADTLPVVVPSTANLSGPFAPASDQSWLTITGTNGGVVNFSFLVNNSPSARVAHISLLGQTVAITQSGTSYNLGTAARLEGPLAGSDSVVLAVVPNNAPWTASANAAWLHLSPANQSGNGSTNVIFGFDANPGPTRAGTLTIAGQTLTVTQAGAAYVATGVAGLVTNLVTGVGSPLGVAVDVSGNVYFPSFTTVQEWSPATENSFGLFAVNDPVGVAVDGSGNVYVADDVNNAIEEWFAIGGGQTTLVSGLNSPTGLAVDRAGNVYFSDSGNHEIKEWLAASHSVNVLVSSGLSNPAGVAVDAAGNVYFADRGTSKVYEWTAVGGNLTTLVASGLNTPNGVAVDGAGNVYIADAANNSIKEWSVAINTLIDLVPATAGLNNPNGVAVDGAGNLYIADTYNHTIDELPAAFVDPAARSESIDGGSDALPVVLPATINLGGVFAPASSQSWLTITSTNGGVVSYSFPPNTSSTSLTAQITLLGQIINITQNGPDSIGAAVRVEGPGSGNDSIVLSVSPSFPDWTNTANADWLHLNPASVIGTGSTNVFFSYDANYGLTRTGTLTIDGLTLSVIQAGSTYVPANLTTNLVSARLSNPGGVAVDGAGNVYIADSGNNAIKEWSAVANVVVPLVNSGLSNPGGVAVDGAGNVYVADTYDNAVEEWSPATSILTPLVNYLNWSLNQPRAVAVDGAGNVYAADTFNNEIVEWMAASSNVTAIVSSGLTTPSGVAVDAADNVYIGDTYNYAVEEWLAAGSNLTPVVTSGLAGPAGVAVDAGGNIYIADTANNAIEEWNVSSASLTTLVSGLSQPTGVAVDGIGNVYYTDTGNNAVGELTYAFVDPTGMSEGGAAGSDSLPAVVPATANLNGPFAPASDSPWLTITGTAGGVVSYSFTANNGPTRTANISLLGQTIPVTQYSLNTYSLGAYTTLEGPAAGSDSIVLGVSPNTGAWTAVTDGTPWLHVNPAGQSGIGSTNIVFSFDANSGATRSGDLIIAGVYVQVTQAGATYVAANLATNLVTTGLSHPGGLAVDGAGNVYIANGGSNSIVLWTLTNNTATTLVSTGLSNPMGVAVDLWGDVYVADTGHNAVREWVTAGGYLNEVYQTNSFLTNLVTGLNQPAGVAFETLNDGLLIANSGAGTVESLPFAGGTPATLVTGLTDPTGVAADITGNVYISDRGASLLDEWMPANSNLTALVSSGLNGPAGVAVDGTGNLYIANYTNNAILKWTAASNSLSTLLSTGLSHPTGVAVDAAGNLYIANNGSNAVEELTYAFVDPTLRMESGAAGSDSLPTVLPATANLSGPFTPVSDSSWLTITGTNNGVVSFSFPNNIGSSRTAHITVLGRTVAVIQNGPSYALGTPGRLVGPAAGSDSVVLAVVPNIATWTAGPNASWLHLNTANQGGTGSTNVVFSFDANAGTTRTGTLTIGGQTLTVTQAGSAYVVANWLTNLVATGLNNPTGLAVDGQGNVFFANSGGYGAYEWTLTNNLAVDLYGLYGPAGVAVNPGNVFFADSYYNAVVDLNATNGVAFLAQGLLNTPEDVAVDGTGNLYIADTGNAAIKKWVAASQTLTNLISTWLIHPTGVAVDAAGNLYIADSGTNVIYEWVAAGNALSVLVPGSSGLSGPMSVAVDGAGNVYIADTGNNAIKKWTVANNSLTTLVSSGLSAPNGVAVDGLGNVYFADSGHNLVKELAQAFVNPAARSENASAGTDSLPVVLPAAENLLPPFAPSSNPSWLTVTGVTNGVVSIAFTATSTNRTGSVTVLGQGTAINQAASGTVVPPVVTGKNILPNGGFQLSFTNSSGASFSVLWTTNVTLPLTNWLLAGSASNLGGGLFQFTTPPLTNYPRQFFRVRSP